MRQPGRTARRARVRSARTCSFRLLAATVIFAAASAGPAREAGAAAGTLPIEDRYPHAGAAYLVEIDGTIVWGRALDAPRAPASLAKLMTALVVLDDGFDPAATVTFSARAARQTGSRIGLRAGERISAGALMDGMLVASANDAAVALAERGGTLSAFVARMNSKARALGLTHTHFANPAGLDAKGQVSTARELRALAEAALAQPEIAGRVALPRATLETTAGRRVEIESSNALLGLVPGVRGVKTGTTSKAGECLIALAEREGHRVVVVLLGAKDRWWSAAALIEAAFRHADVAPVSGPSPGPAPSPPAPSPPR